MNDKRKSGKETAKEFICQKCGHSFSCASKLKAHMFERKTDCTKKFMKKGAKKINDAKQLSSDEEQEDNQVDVAVDQRFECEKCGEQFHNKSNLTRHIYDSKTPCSPSTRLSRNLGVKHFECKKCGKVFGCKTGLKRHLNNKKSCTKKINRPYKVCKEKILLFNNYLV